MTTTSAAFAIPATASGRLVAILFAALCSSAWAADLQLNEQGLGLTITGMAHIEVPWPMLMPGEKKPIESHLSARSAELKYANGAEVSISLAPGGVVEYRWHHMPKEVVSFHLTTSVGADIGDGGTWRIGAGPATAFPKDKPAKPFLYQGNDNGITITDVIGHSVTITVPDHSYQQLQDNREWGNPIFQWQAWVPYNKDWEAHRITISEGAAPKAKILVDRFGQTTRKEFPGKVTDDRELTADAASDAAYYAGLAPAATDSWGGRVNSGIAPALKVTGFFRVEKRGARWLLVDPDGNPCFHLGICSFGFTEDYTYTLERQGIFAWLPPVSGDPFSGGWHHDAFWHDKAFSFLRANLLRKYGTSYDPDSHVGVMVDRVRAMGFNAIGAFSGDPSFTAKHIPRVEMCGFGPELPGIRGIPDPFDAESLKRMDDEWSKGIASRAGDPLIVGYFFANEQAFEDIARGVPPLPGKHAAKRRLVKMLEDEYPGIDAFNAAWNLHAASFPALADQGLAVTTDKAIADMKAYNELFLEAYYQAITTTFRKYDRNHLMLGNRWQPGTSNSEMLCRIAGKYMDVISINYYTLGIDRAFIQRLHQWTGDKPQMWSEWNYTSGTESNVAPSALDLKTQRLRGQAYRTYVEQAASLGFVVGSEWFTLIDQAVSGRFFQLLNGERSNSGIFNVADRPYRDMVEEVAAAHREIYAVWLEGKIAFAIDDPRFHAGAGAGTAAKQLQAGHALGPITIDGSLKQWPGRPPELIGSDRLVLGSDGKGLEAAVKLCWDEANLYVLAQVSDPTPLMNASQGKELWNGDCLELLIGGEKPDQAGALLPSDRRLLLAARPVLAGAANPWYAVNAAQQPDIRLINVPSVEGAGYTLEAAIPWSAIGVAPKENLVLLLDIAIDDGDGHGRTRQLVWSGGAHTAEARTGWGRLQLVP
jgi:hypothetical protein